MEEEKKNFKERWISFVRVIFDPWVVALYLLIGVLIIFYSQAKEDYVKSLLTLLFSVVAGLLGGIYTKRRSDLNEEKILIARGTTAIRSLKLLLQQIVSAENRARLFFKRNEKETIIELTKSSYEEIIDKCKLLEEQTIGAIENWNDIIPEADVKTQIGIISELKQKEEELGKKIESITEQKESSDKQKDLKEIELNKAKNDLDRLRTELRTKEERLNLSGLSGITSGSVTAYMATSSPHKFFGGVDYYKCNDCQNTFVASKDFLGINFQKECPTCKSKNIVRLE